MFKNFVFHIYSLFIVLLFLADCCGNKSNATYAENYPILIDIKEAMRNQVNFKYSDILFDSITFIPIESIIGSYITSLDGTLLRFTSNYIFAENYFNGGELVCYNRNGKFIRKVAQRGRGPGEFSDISDIAIDEKNEIVYVLCTSGIRIFKYSFQGKFIELIYLTHPADRIIVNSENQLLVHFPNWGGDLQYSCLLLDNKGNTINKLKNNIFYSLNDKRKFWKKEGLFYIYNDQIHIKDKCDTLFVVENDQFIPKYIFSTGENHSNKLSQLEYDRKVSINYIHETESKIFFQFGINKIGYIAYYDKKIGKAFSTTREIINDMYDRQSIYLSMFTYQYNDEIIMRNNSFDMVTLKKNVSTSKYLEISNMLDALKDEDPVILSILHLKKINN